MTNIISIITQLLWATLLCFCANMLIAQSEVELRPDGIILPRIDSSTVVAPSTGQIIYEAVSGQLIYFDGARWQALSTWQPSGNNIYRAQGNVGIGTEEPQEQLELTGNLRLPATTATSGIIYADNDRLIHGYGTGNFFAGLLSGNLTTTGENNIGVGADALQNNTTGGENTALGSKAMINNTDGGGNVAVGADALIANVSGVANVAVGRSALSNNIHGGSNTAVGSSSLLSNMGTKNTAVGQGAMLFNTTGENNTAIGVEAMAANVSGNNNIAIGYRADVLSPDLEYATAIGAEAKVAASYSIVLGGTGSHAVNVGIGDTSPDALLEVSAGAGTTDLLQLSSGTEEDGDILTVTSDGRLSIGSVVPGAEVSIVARDSVTDMMSLTGEDGVEGAVFTVKNDGKVGIGTATPQARLEVRGKEGENTNLLTVTPAGDAQDPYMVILSTGQIGLGEIVPAAQLEITADIGSHDPLMISSSDTEDGDMLIVTNDGNIGIGTETPDERVVISGTSESSSSIALDNTGGGNNNSHLEFRSGGATIAEIRSFTSNNLDGVLNFRTADNGTLENRMSIRPNGNIGIGTTLPGVRLEVEDNSIDGNLLRLDDGDGQCDHNPESGSEIVSCTSDARLKSHIRDAAPVLDDLMKLQVRDYEVIASGDEMTGLIAQEVQEVFPEMVTEREDGYLMVTQVNHWKIVKAIQELKLENDELEVELEERSRILTQELEELEVLISRK